MTSEELHDRYVAEIDKRGGSDNYIDGVEERELMQIAIQHGYPPERARAVVVEVCREKGYVIEAALVQFIREQLKSRIRPNGELDASSFDAIIRETGGRLSKTTRSEYDVRQLVDNTIADAGYRLARPWWSPAWFQRFRHRSGKN